MNTPIIYDKAKYHFESIKINGLPEIHAYIHTGLFLGWLIENSLLDHEFLEGVSNDIQRFIKREISGPELFSMWDGVLDDEMLNDDGNKFTHIYFDFKNGQYIYDYIKYLAEDLPSEFHVQDTWENYEKAKIFIDEGYERWKLSQLSSAIVGDKKHIDKETRKKLKNLGKAEVERRSSRLHDRLKDGASTVADKPSSTPGGSGINLSPYLTLKVRASLEILSGIVAFVLVYYFMEAGGPNPTGGMFYLAAIAAPCALTFVGLLELVTGYAFTELSDKWDDLAAWSKFLISMFTIAFALLILVLFVYSYGHISAINS